MRENGMPETRIEKLIFSQTNQRPDLMLADLVSKGLMKKEEAIEKIAHIPKIIESPDSLKVYYNYTRYSQSFDGCEYSSKLFKEYPAQIRFCGYICFCLSQEGKRVLDRGGYQEITRLCKDER